MISPLRRSALGLLLACSFAFCAAQTPEPQNIDQLKTELRAYHDRGYPEQVAKVAAEAIQWLQQRSQSAKPGEKLTAVFDVDETLVSTWAYMTATDFSYNETTCNNYLQDVALPAIEPVKSVFLAARKLGIDVVVITGRRESMRARTAENLRQIGCGDFSELVCRAQDSKGTILDYKSAARQRLASSGRIIVLTIGDQRSDLDGGYAERLFKLPNPFYYIP